MPLFTSDVHDMHIEAVVKRFLVRLTEGNIFCGSGCGFITGHGAAGSPSASSQRPPQAHANAIADHNELFANSATRKSRNTATRFEFRISSG